MITLVWSLISSLSEVQQKRQLAELLRNFFAQQKYARDKKTLVWRLIRDTYSQHLEPSTNNSGLIRHASESHLTTDLIFRNDQITVHSETAEELRPSQWRFGTSLEANSDQVYFIVETSHRRDDGPRQLNTIQEEGRQLFLDSCCERIAWHRTRLESLYTCSFAQFVEIVFAFSEGFLSENHASAVVVTLYTLYAPPDGTISLSSSPSRTFTEKSLTASINGQFSRALPLLEQLFWGDVESLCRHSSESALNSLRSTSRSDSGNLSLRYNRLSTGRNPWAQPLSSSSFSSNAAEFRLQFVDRLDSLLQSRPSRFDCSHELPPFIKFLDSERGTSQRSNHRLSHSLPSSRRNTKNMERLELELLSQDEVGVRHRDNAKKKAAAARGEVDLGKKQKNENTKNGEESFNLATVAPGEKENCKVAKIMANKSGFKNNARTPCCSFDSEKEVADFAGEDSLRAEFMSTVDKLRHIDSTIRGDEDTPLWLQKQLANFTSSSAPIKENGSEPNQEEKKEVNGSSTTVRRNSGANKYPLPVPHVEISYNECENTLVPQSESNAGKYCVISRENEGSTEVTLPVNNWERAEARHSQSLRQNRRDEEAKHNKDENRLPILVKSPRRHSSAVAPGSRFEANNKERHRSISPDCHPPWQFYERRSLKAFSNDSNSLFSRKLSVTGYLQKRRQSAASVSSLRAMAKPPSILVYTANDSALFARIRANLSSYLATDEYTVFNISAESIRKQPWIEPSTACLVVAQTRELDDAAWHKMQLYFNQTGKIIFVCQNHLLSSLTHCDSTKQQADLLKMAFGPCKTGTMSKDFEKFLKKSLKKLLKTEEINEKFAAKDLNGGFSYTVVLKKDKDQPLLLYMHNNNSHHASAVFSDATTDQLLSPASRLLRDLVSSVGVAVCDVAIPELTKAGIRYGEEIGQTPKLFFRKSEVASQQGMPEPKDVLLPVEVMSNAQLLKEPSTSDDSFDFNAYFNKLSTQTMGRFLLHVPVTTTTMDVSQSLNDCIPTLDGAIVIADQQVKGKGRGNNEFISPVGAAMFTFSFCLPSSCNLSRNPSFIQHVFAVALVDAARRLSGHEDFPLFIKWPNDFYFNRSYKVGGMLATCRCRDDSLLVTIGAGINVSNSKPTVCLNDMLPENSENPLKREEVIAETLNRFQYWLTIYEMKGDKDVLKKYYEFWLHNGQNITLEDLGEKVIIQGLDKYGYLQVRSKTNSSKIFSVGDDGNTFDMFKGLIRHKT
ncbi:hypothetical protein WR25_15442 [Diploscapter pachys]|uniref:BPL/LPL catalytic domain-containing protein n=1 Tax=Diploscapter pachys TaxID=2018661 RepID=A0A2A2JFD2_9BILA|nr:hypothetical protein WR25_15442 [Diploscapter pachys]